MSFVTTCTQCLTRFLIKPEQLAVRKGRVRCGSCQHVFNALLNVQEAAAHQEVHEATVEQFATEQYPEIPDETAVLDEQHGHDNTEQADEHSHSNEVEREVESEEDSSQLTAELGEGNYKPLQAWEVPQETPHATTLVNVESDSHETALEDTSPTQAEYNDDLPTASGSVDANISIALNPELASGPAVLEQIALPDKLTPHKRKVEVLAVTNTRASSTSSGWFLIIVLLLIAALQTTYFLRTSISSTWPASKAYFVTACAYIGCKVDLPKNADLIVLDDSDLHEDAERPGLIRLNSTLVNNAAYAQQYPMLEVTLTDSSDAPVLRRTFKPADYLATGSDPQLGIAAKDEVHIHLALSADDKSVSGYRVFVTY